MTSVSEHAAPRTSGYARGRTDEPMDGMTGDVCVCVQPSRADCSCSLHANSGFVPMTTRSWSPLKTFSNNRSARDSYTSSRRICIYHLSTHRPEDRSA